MSLMVSLSRCSFAINLKEIGVKPHFGSVYRDPKMTNFRGLDF